MLTGYRPMFTAAEDGIRAAAAFTEPQQWRYDWQRAYTRDEWLDQVPTHGGFALLSEPQRADPDGRHRRRGRRRFHHGLHHRRGHRLPSGSRSRCSATPATTSTTPMTSATVGIWVSTTTPMTVAVAGSRDTIRA